MKKHSTVNTAERKKLSTIDLLYLAAGALFLFFTGGRFNFWLAAWFSSIFFIRFARGQRAFMGYILVSAASWIVSFFAWYGIQPAGGIFHAINMLVGSLISSLPILLDRVLSRKVPRFARTLVFPVFSTAIEYLLVSGNPMGSFGSLAYTQYRNLALIQIVSLSGMMAVSFLICWFASVVNELWESKWKVRDVRAVVLSFVLVLAFVYVYGGLRLTKSRSTNSSSSVSVSMIIRSEEDTTLRDIMSKEGEQRFELADKVFDSFLANTLLEKDADVVCWPEGAVVTTDTLFPLKDQMLKDLSKAGNFFLVAPYLVIPEDGPSENKLVLYTPDGESAFSHTKYGGNMFEGSVPGDGTLRFADSPFGRLSALICWDMDFPEPVRQAGKNRVDILFSPSSEWREIVPVHAQMAVFRGIENGASTVHPAALGLSVIADPYGREIVSSNWFTSPETVIRGKVSDAGVKTVYASIGDLFSQIVLLAAALIIGYAIVLRIAGIVRKRRTGRGGSLIA